MKSFIFNADDLGWSELVDLGIFKSAEKGVVKSASLFVNSPRYKDAYKQAVDKGISVGIHLNVSGPGTFLNKNNTLFGENGKVKAALSKQIVLTQNEWKEVFEEFERQMNRFSKELGKPDHINNHHALYLAEGFTINFCQFLLKYNLPTRWFHDMKCPRLIHPNHSEFDFYDVGKLTKNHLIKLLDNAPDGVTEVILHPGFYDKTLNSSYNQERQKQVDVLTDGKLKHHLVKKDYKNITFNEINRE